MGTATDPQSADLAFERKGDILVARLTGAWTLAAHPPETATVESEIGGQKMVRVTFDTSALTDWDTALLTFLLRFGASCRLKNLEVDRGGLPAGVRRLLELAEAVPQREGGRGQAVTSGLERIGDMMIQVYRMTCDGLDFLGESVLAFANLLIGRARYRAGDLFVHIQQAGAEALPIVSLISFLVGLIFAFVGAVQLQQFGATIYVANLVGISMVRDMGAMMTAIVMAGRTGASYAAQLGSMKVTQEIDALTTMGLAPMEFLVLPRMIALFLMMPLLCLYSDLLGILGGALVGVGMLDISPATYFRQTAEAVRLVDLSGGLLKAAVYGVLIALASCRCGMRSGNSSSAVGEATTSAVVASIVSIIVACGVFAVLFYILGI
jgi:phospholipid/cholesterol/gamma-HCH transport system permease protein